MGILVNTQGDIKCYNLSQVVGYVHSVYDFMKPFSMFSLPNNKPAE